jgi:hypothetical protein
MEGMIAVPGTFYKSTGIRKNRLQQFNASFSDLHDQIDSQSSDRHHVTAPGAQGSADIPKDNTENELVSSLNSVGAVAHHTTVCRNQCSRPLLFESISVCFNVHASWLSGWILTISRRSTTEFIRRHKHFTHIYLFLHIYKDSSSQHVDYHLVWADQNSTESCLSRIRENNGKFFSHQTIWDCILEWKLTGGSWLSRPSIGIPIRMKAVWDQSPATTKMFRSSLWRFLR